MNKRQVRKMLREMVTGEPVTVVSPMASVKKLARFAYVAQQFGYEYADVRQGGQHNSELTMLLVPDPTPQGRTRAARNWAQYPNAGDGAALPPLVPEAVELLKARIKFDLTGRHSEKRKIRIALIAFPIACLSLAYNLGGDTPDFVLGGVLCAVLLALLPAGIAWSRRHNAQQAALLQAAGFTQVRDETGRLRYVPPGGQLPGHGNPFGGGIQEGNPFGGGAPVPPPGPSYGGGPSYGDGAAVPPPATPTPGPYAVPGPYATPGPYAPQGGHYAPGPHAAQPAPHPQQNPHQPHQNPYWQPPHQ